MHEESILQVAWHSLKSAIIRQWGALPREIALDVLAVDVLINGSGPQTQPAPDVPLERTSQQPAEEAETKPAALKGLRHANAFKRSR